MKIRAWADYGWVNTHNECIIEVDDDATEAEIEEAVWEWAIERVETNWERIE